MTALRSRWLLVALLATTGCFWPTGEDIENEQERVLRSVSGPWIGVSPMLTLNFELSQGAGNSVSGSGTMRETPTSPAVPITVTGTFQRPQLSLTFGGMHVDGQAVQGTFQGSYTTTGGISAPLHLSATGYTRDIAVLLQEQ